MIFIVFTFTFIVLTIFILIISIFLYKWSLCISVNYSHRMLSNLFDVVFPRSDVLTGNHVCRIPNTWVIDYDKNGIYRFIASQNPRRSDRFGRQEPISGEYSARERAFVRAVREDSSSPHPEGFLVYYITARPSRSDHYLFRNSGPRIWAK